MSSNAFHILTVNTGSSSLKAALYPVSDLSRRDISIDVRRIGLSGGSFRASTAAGVVLADQQVQLPDHPAALDALLGWLSQRDPAPSLAAVGHRVVHGGRRYSRPQRVTPALLAALRSLIPLDPLHLPQAIQAVEAVGDAFPQVPQVACFDTSFHRSMPRVAQMLALPHDLQELGVVRYGFHGLSYEYIMEELRRLDPAGASGRVVIAHLGNGASMAAVQDGRSVDTTMGMTPTGGLVMGTRCGDLDPGALLFLLQEQGMSPDQLNALVNRQAGLLGVSGCSADMQDLLQREADDPAAADAVALFCYQAKKFLGALAATLGGLDTLVFTGGIGEHAAPVRQRVCAGLGFLGLELDAARNESGEPVISGENSAVTVRVIATDEDLTIARHTASLLQEGDRTGVSI
jgi:acetate kinase